MGRVGYATSPLIETSTSTASSVAQQAWRTTLTSFSVTVAERARTPFLWLVGGSIACLRLRVRDIDHADRSKMRSERHGRRCDRRDAHSRSTRSLLRPLCLDNCLPNPLTVDVSGKTWHPGRLWCEGLWECKSVCGGVPSLSRGRRAVSKLQCRQSLLVNEDRSTVSGLLL